MHLKAAGRQMQRILILTSASFERNEKTPAIAWRVYFMDALSATNQGAALPSPLRRMHANPDSHTPASHSQEEGGSVSCNLDGVGTWAPSHRATGRQNRQKQQDNLRLAQVDLDLIVGRREDLALKHEHRKSMFSPQSSGNSPRAAGSCPASA